MEQHAGFWTTRVRTRGVVSAWEYRGSDGGVRNDARIISSSDNKWMRDFLGFGWMAPKKHSRNFPSNIATCLNSSNVKWSSWFLSKCLKISSTNSWGVNVPCAPQNQRKEKFVEWNKRNGSSYFNFWAVFIAISVLVGFFDHSQQFVSFNAPGMVRIEDVETRFLHAQR